MPAVEKKTVLRFGLSEVHAPNPPSSAQVDLVFVHGLNGDPERTWTSKETQAFWPKDLLPEYIDDQKGRVLVYGYDADVASLGSGVSKDKLHNHSERLVADLFANRRIRKATERPIIFIAHSLGGLIVKRALIGSAEVTGAKTEHLRSIYVSTYGILFLGTPHKGSDLGKWGTYLTWLCQAVLPNKLASSEPQLVEALKLNSETLINIDRQFAQLMDDFHIFFLHEAKPTNLKGTLHFIVDEDSAAPALPDVERAGIQADHSHMCKFDSSSSPGFDLVIDGIQRYADDAPNVIRNRWVMEKRERLTRAVRKAKENYPVILEQVNVPLIPTDSPLHESPPSTSTADLTTPARNPPSQSSSSTDVFQSGNRVTEPYFIVPPGFRANTFFVGMEKEMHELDRSLFDSRRKDGTACVLLHGQPGSGKSHVARQYVFKNRYKFQGGVFWINAHLPEEVYKDYWQIHQRVIAKVAPEHVHNSSENLGRNFLDDVREWFCDRDEWLIVFDGVSPGNEAEVSALQRCIPDSPNSGIIYVSRSRRLENMQRLLRPQGIKISGLKEQDARNLLFKEIGLRNPREAQIKAAKSLVKKVGGLPLAVSAIARRLADTHEPIEKFSLKSYADDPKLGGTYNHILSDLEQNDHREAINLMNVICFFGPRIPVEMIHLGLQALRDHHVEVRASEEGRNRDLNITFGILMRHSLLERNESDDSDSMSSSQDSIVDGEPIDVLNLHAVIQKYWSDSLNASKQLPLWLGRAIALLTVSHQQASIRMTQQEKIGRASDLRWYLVHARCLRRHCAAYESRHQRIQDLKEDIDGMIERLDKEIKAREPGSSQESIEPAEFQISVFDRTSTSSSSGPSQASLDEPTPEPFLMNIEQYGQLHFKSPTQLAGTALDPRVASLGAEYRFPVVYSYPMQKENSASTVRPESSSDVLDPGTHLTKRPLISPDRSDSFRASSAMPMVQASHAVGSVSSGPQLQKSGDPETSYAMSSLASLHSRTPSSPSGSRFFWHRSPSRMTITPRHPISNSPIRQSEYQDPLPLSIPQDSLAPETSTQTAVEGLLTPRSGLIGGPQLSSEYLQAVLAHAQAQGAIGFSPVMQPSTMVPDGTNVNQMPLQFDRNISVHNISAPLQSRRQSRSPSRGGSRGGSRGTSRAPSRPPTNQTSHQTSPRFPFSATMQQAGLASEGHISPVAMSRDNSDRSQNIAATSEIAHIAHQGLMQGVSPISPLQRAILPQQQDIGLVVGPGHRNSTSGAERPSFTGGREHAMPLVAVLPDNAGSTTYAAPWMRGTESDPASRRASAQSIASDGLGITAGSAGPFTLGASRDTQQSGLSQQRLPYDSRLVGRVLPRELAERDANLNLRAFSLNRTKDISEGTGFRSNELPGNALETYDQGVAQVQAMQQLQALQNPTVTSMSDQMALGTAAGLVNSAVLPIDLATATRLGVPVLPAQVLYESDHAGLSAQTFQPRRRTVSAPESPGPQIEQKLWGQ